MYISEEVYVQLLGSSLALDRFT